MKYRLVVLAGVIAAAGLQCMFYRAKKAPTRLRQPLIYPWLLLQIR